MLSSVIAVKQGGVTVRSWYREPMVWLVMIIPFLSLAGGLATVVIAFHDKDTVLEPPADTASAMNPAESALNTRTAQLGVVANARVVGNILTVELRVGHATTPAELIVTVSDGALEGSRPRIVLAPDGSGRYVGQFPYAHDKALPIEIVPGDRVWRLRGTLVNGESSVLRAPEAR
jgi:hypothetical protein